MSWYDVDLSLTNFLNHSLQGLELFEVVRGLYRRRFRGTDGSQHSACQDNALSHILKLMVSTGEKILNNINVVV